MRHQLLAALAVAAATGLAGQALAAEYKVQLLNNGPDGAMAFSPSALKLKPGDTVRFMPTDMGHNAEIITGMLPPGAAPAKGMMNKELVYTFTKAGTYAFKCTPHYGMGMVFVAKVGDGAPNLADVQTATTKAPPLAKKRFAAAFSGVK